MQDAVEILQLIGPLAAVTVFLVCAAMAWNLRNTFQQWPIAGYSYGLLLVMLGTGFDSTPTVFKAASTIFTAGIIGLGVSIVASSLVAAPSSKKVASPLKEIEDDSIVAAYTATIIETQASISELGTREMAEKHRKLRLAAANDLLCRLLRERTELICNLVKESRTHF